MKDRELNMSKKSVAKIQAYQKVFGTPQGREVLMDLANAHGLMRSTFHQNVNEMILKEGERNVILRILSITKTNIKDLVERIEDYERESI